MELKQGTDLKDLPSNWVCPVCGIEKDYFYSLENKKPNYPEKSRIVSILGNMLSQELSNGIIFMDEILSREFTKFSDKCNIFLNPHLMNSLYFLTNWLIFQLNSSDILYTCLKFLFCRCTC